MKATKQKILAAALKLYNQDGIVNVRLQHIADEAFVSVGNLAYHFRNKEAITSSLYKTLTKKQGELLTKYRIVPLFDNIDLLLRHTFELQNQYVFFYLDTLEIVRAYPAIATDHQRYIASQVSQLKSIIDFNVARGAVMADTLQEHSDKLALQIWMTMDLWLAQQAIRTNTTPLEQEFKDAIWALLQPHFTEMGKLEYRQMLQMPEDLLF